MDQSEFEDGLESNPYVVRYRQTNMPTDPAFYVIETVLDGYDTALDFAGDGAVVKWVGTWKAPEKSTPTFKNGSPLYRLLTRRHRYPALKFGVELQ